MFTILINLLKTLTLTETLILKITLTIILKLKPYTIIFTRILVSSAYTVFNVIRYRATAIFRFDRLDSLQAI